ncbi:MAG: nucleotide-diphospho-sugar transferase [Monoraphidium minutum]|nr:MAG: nucleotide-diphospho-sugar transferase [Monoraphidium minutum]
MTTMTSAAAPPAALAERCGVAGQQHVLEDWAALSEAERGALTADALDFSFIRSALTASLAAAGAAGVGAKPPAGVVALSDGEGGGAARAEWRELGLKLIAQGKVGVLLLAGGQGTRLGSKLPKGCYDIGLPSGKSLFQLQAERLLALQRLAAAAAGGGGAPLRWFIMTSPFTHADTVAHFEAGGAHFEAGGYFGLDPAQVTFFQQGFLPCMTEEGVVIMESGSKVAKAPDGNGGLYRALALSGALDQMKAAGLEALDVYCVDNSLARLGDPEFVGCCYARGTQVGARVLAKASPEEKVGVFAATPEGRLQVLEYSELDPAKASATDPATGQLYFNWSNICMHYFSIPWLEATVKALSGPGAAYHVARKAIPSKTGAKIPGVKLEMFIFDPFHTAEATTLFEVARDDHFAPVKNAPGSDTDSPDTARALLLGQGARWASAAGAAVAGGCAGLEVPPLVSYAGEGLEGVVRGKAVNAPGPWLLGADGSLSAGKQA